MTALGLLFIFCLMGAAYVDYMSITIDRTHYEQRLLRVQTLASSGVQAGVGEMQQALASGRVAELLAAPREIQLPVYGPNRQDPKGFAPQTNRLGAVKVTITEEHGPLADLAAKGATAPVRCYRILSESRISDLGPNNREMQTTHGRAEAVIVFGERSIPRTIYWNETNR
ncbi:MAG: hypothetical protein NTU83_08650 [Candidatus Hydrogenedentes bacterium]|nr:hypothetical protein [Candidatus Hydrogenedentota bacterium]